MESSASRVLLVLWVFTLLLAAVCLGVYAYGVVRDTRPAESSVAVDLGRDSDWISEPFRLWGGGPHTLYLTTVNHTPPFGDVFDGEVAVRVVNGAGRPVFAQSFPGSTRRHVRPNNMERTPLEQLRVGDTPLRTWRLEARVVRGDSAFVGVSSRVVLRRDRRDPGMGGLLNYVMIFPGLALALMAVGLAALLARGGGSRLPLVASLTLLLLALLAVI